MITTNSFNIRVCYLPEQWFKTKSYILCSEIYFTNYYLVVKTSHNPEYNTYIPKHEIIWMEILPNPKKKAYFYQGKLVAEKTEVKIV